MVTYRKLGRWGRWGNQLFQYVGVVLYAKKNGYKAVFPRWTGCDVFQGIKPYTRSEYFLSRILPTRQLDDFRSYNQTDRILYYLGLKKALPELHSLSSLYEHPEDFINFRGYFQDPFSLELLKKQKNDILKIYAFKNEIESAYRTVATPYEPYIALHLRRGDFVKLGYALPSSWYHETLKKIHNGRPIYVASDDPTILNELRTYNLKTFSARGGSAFGGRLINPLSTVPDFIFDFWMIKNAQTVIGCGSTFSWWAAYLGNKNNYYSPPLTHLWPKDKNVSIQKIEI